MKLINRQWLWFFCIILALITLLLMAVIHSWGNEFLLDFYPTNGTWQNYNPVRRLLAGQIVGLDFMDYLGLGHLLSGSLLTWCCGDNYYGSLVAFDILIFGCLVLLTCALDQAIFAKSSVAAISSAITVCLIDYFIKNPICYSSNEIFCAFLNFFAIGNSARFVRALIVPLVVLLLYWGRARFKGRYWRWQLAVVGALSLVWSNDYGISSAVCLLVVGLVVLIGRREQFLKSIIYVTSTVVVAFLLSFSFIAIVTWGHPCRYWAEIFSIGQYQDWYYNSLKSFYIFDLDWSPYLLIQAGLICFYLIKLLLQRGSDSAILRYGVLAWLNMVPFCAAQEYRLLSGGYCREFAIAVLFLTIFYELLYWASKRFRKDPHKELAVLLVMLGGVGYSVWELGKIVELRSDRVEQAIYFPKLGGVMRGRSEDIQAGAKFLKGCKIFSTYASAQEALADQFQPSGRDYIIHVLGDQNRLKYLKSFRAQDFTYVVTINRSFSDWEKWCERANWFFYREIYRNWHPVFRHSFATYWEKNQNNKQVLSGNYPVKIERINEHTQKLIIQTATNINGQADILIDYAVTSNERFLHYFLIRKMLKVQGDLGDYNYLRPRGREFIPMRVRNGYGELTVSSCPQESTCLILNYARCQTIFSTSHFIR